MSSIDDLLAELDDAINDNSSRTTSNLSATASSTTTSSFPNNPSQSSFITSKFSSFNTSANSNSYSMATTKSPSNPSSKSNSILDDLLMDMDDVTSDLVPSNSRLSSIPSSTVKQDIQSSTTSMKPMFSNQMKTNTTNTSTNANTSSFLSNLTTGCNPLILYGEQPSSSLSRPCSHLRCTQCDHTVICLPQAKWDNQVVDYFFFRINVPDLVKLHEGIITDGKYSAYCCQCAWHSSTGIENITAAQLNGKDPYNQEGEASVKQLRWICSKR